MQGNLGQYRETVARDVPASLQRDMDREEQERHDRMRRVARDY